MVCCYLGVCRAGLAQVLDSLLGFDGCEFYIAKWPQLQGKTFAELMYHFHEAVVIGILRYESTGELEDGVEGGDSDEDPSSGVDWHVVPSLFQFVGSTVTVDLLCRWLGLCVLVRWRDLAESLHGHGAWAPRQGHCDSRG